MNKRSYQMCTRCVMDTTDPEITFDENGVCNHCHEFDSVTSKTWYPNDEGSKLLEDIVEDIKRAGSGSEYDCIMGLSGGVDSSYLALKMKEFGLRPLVVHVDAGWNSELAVYNIEQIVKYCGYNLHTHVMDWDEVRDLQVAYLRAGVANQDVPQDHAFFSSMYHFSIKNKIRYIISGGNLATEAVFPSSWHHSAMDAVNLHAIHKEYGKRKLKQYRTISMLQYYFWYPLVNRMRTVRPLNYMPYNKEDAVKYLKQKIGYKEYGRKHGESVFTKFFQNYYLPEKFGYDKRKPHFSSMILSGQMTREDALLELDKPLYADDEIKQDMEYIAKKLGLSMDELDGLVHASGTDAAKFKNWDRTHRVMKSIQSKMGALIGKKLKVYS